MLHNEVLLAVIDLGGKGQYITRAGMRACRRAGVPLANTVVCGTPQKKKPPPLPIAVAAPTPEETVETKLKQSIR
jgi:hypothetical protein